MKNLLLSGFLMLAAAAFAQNGNDTATTASFWAAATPTQFVAAPPELLAKIVAALREMPEPVVDSLCPAEGIPKAILSRHLEWPRYLAWLRHKERGACADLFLAETEKMLPALPPDARVVHGIETTNMFLFRDDVPAALRTARQTLKLADESHNLQGWAQFSLAKTLHIEYKTFDELVLLTESARQWAEAHGDWELQMHVLFLTGKVNRDIFFGHTLRAVPYLEKAQALAESHADSLAMLSIYSMLAYIYEDARLFDKEMAYTAKALEIVKKIPSPRALANLWKILERYYSINGEPEKSREWHQKALTLIRKTQSKRALADLLIHSYGDFMGQGKMPEAYAALSEAQTLDKNNLQEAWYNYYKRTGNLPEALRWLEQAYGESSTHYMSRNALLLSYWETIYRTKEVELQVVAEKKQQHYLMLLLMLSAAILLVTAIAFVGRIRNARKLRKQNLLIEQQANELLRLDELKSRFFANVSHELRTPLTLVLGPLNFLLKKEAAGPEIYPTLQLMKQSSQQLLFLVNEILDLSKLDAGKLLLKEEPVAFYPLIHRLVSSFESHAHYLGIQLTFEFRADRNLHLSLDQNLYKKVFYNLLSNALKFTPKEGRVNVIIEDTGSEIGLTVKDTGRGIHPDDLPHIFDRFYQSKLPNAPVEGGTGIGLAYCAEVAHLMQGKIFAESMLSEGAAFHFRIPKKESLGYVPDYEELLLEDGDLPLPRAIDDAPSETVGNAASGTIFMAEDNHSLRLFLKKLLAESYRVKAFPNGLELWNHLSALPQEQFPDLVVTDLMMPEMDGYQLIDKIKKDERLQAIPLVVLTAKASAQDRLEALRIGVDDYLLKPFDEEELIARVNGLVSNARLRQERGSIDEALSETTPPPSENSTEPKPPPLNIAQQQQWLADLNAYIEQHMGNSELNAENIALGLNISRSTLYRFLRDYTGFTPAQYLTECRFRKARYLLENGLAQSVKGVSFEVGYRQVKHFSREFKLLYGKSPSDYLKEM